jgi:hypothetical protein
VKARVCTPVGYEVVDRGKAVTAWTAGDQLKNGDGGWSKLPAGAAEADGIGLMDAYAGQDGCDIGIHGEMDGFSGMTPGTPLYPSASVAGGLDTTAPEAASITGVDEVQTLTISGSPAGGTYTLTYAGQTTAGIAYNANAAAIQSALEALSNLAPGDVAVTGTDPFTITFGGTLAAQDAALIVGNGASLTGGSSPAATVVETTAGTPGVSVPATVRVKAASATRIRYNYV